MPFTLAHPAAVLPLPRLLGAASVPSALVVGSVAPDLAYFIPFPISRAESHSILGLAWFSLPAGAAFFLAFHLLLSPLIYSLAPMPLRCRLPAFWWSGSLQSARPFPVLLSILAGALTHLAWDCFTHGDGFAVQRISWLRTPLASVGGYTVFSFKILQHGSTLLGVAILLIWGTRYLTSCSPSEPRHGLAPRVQLALLLALTVPPVLAALRSAVGAAQPGAPPVYQLQQVVGASIFAAGSTLLLVALLLGAALRLLRRTAP